MNDKNWIKFRMIAWSIVAILLAIVLAVGIKGLGGNIFSGNIFSRGFTLSNMKVVKELKFDDIDDIKNIKTDFNTSDLIITENDEENIKVIVNSNKNLKNKKYKLKFDDIDDIKNIKTDFNTSDLIITENDEENIKVIVNSNKNLKNKKYINAEVRSQILNIEDFNNKSSRNIFGIFNGYYLEVEMKIPKSYKENITINNRVGDITFNSDLNLNKLDINIKTGDIDGNQSHIRKI